MTIQGTTEVMTVPKLEPGQKWTKFASINHSNVPPHVVPEGRAGEALSSLFDD